MKEIHSDYTQVPFDRILDQIIYDLDVSPRKLDLEDFPSLEIVYGLKDINVEYDADFARKFYLHMAECFACDEAYIAYRDFSYPEYYGFTLPCDYQAEIYKAIGLNEKTRPEDGCPYCPYESYFGRCRYRYHFSPKSRIFEIANTWRWAKHIYKVDTPGEEQFNYVVRHIKEFEKYKKRDISWLTLEKARIIWKKSYELLAYWPLKAAVKIKGDN